jgi:hypothetical protein
MKNAAPVEEKCQACNGTGHQAVKQPSQPQDISAALQGMRRERTDHEELGSIRPLRAAVARVDEVIE